MSNERTMLPIKLNVEFILIMIVLAVTSCNTDEARQYDLVISNVNLIDGSGAPLQKNVTLIIDSGKIERIIRPSDAKISASATLDGSDKYIIPGLMDAHAHASEMDVDLQQRSRFSNGFKAMIHYGVTSTILLGGYTTDYAKMKALQAASLTDDEVSPRIYFSSPIVTIKGAHPMKTYPNDKWVDGKTVYLLDDTTYIRPIVREAKSQEAIGIKIVVEDGPTPPVIERIPASAIEQITEAATKEGMAVYAHTSDMEEVRMCLDAGITHLVHFTGAMIDWEQDRQRIKRMAQHRGAWITTLMLAKSLIYYRLNPQWLDRPEILNVYDSAMISRLKTPTMVAEGMKTLKAISGTDTLRMETFFKPMVQDLIRVSQHGVNVVLGTDVMGDPFIFPGLSLHEEMEILQKGGVEPLQIITMASYNGAKMLGIENEFGSLEPGKYADFILLSKNPLDDIRNTLTIERVFKGGKEQPRIPVKQFVSK